MAVSVCVWCLGCQTGCRWGFSDLFINPSGDLTRAHTHTLKYMVTSSARPIGTYHCKNISEDYNRNVFFTHAHTPVSITHTYLPLHLVLQANSLLFTNLSYLTCKEILYTGCARTVMLNSVHMFNFVDSLIMNNLLNIILHISLV